MPYRTNKGLPANVRKNLPQGAQTIYRKAFNNAFKQYKEPSKRRGTTSREVTSHKVAWNAVKREYAKKGDKWVRI
jgi:cation transport regulator